ncbi:MAG: haloacid dehalogenase, type II [Acidocella sp. 20-57-95]|nr:MAG: haloacid dehalogenase, type II [Acidocella sp. 20-57-95]OYV62464.1 MAG: haloacid dehalogenase, type II [Acidocella sp. 21-58-7]HQT64097.1 haloacid dehalogenase type II [Acidocella sp.]HQU03686.1 haloacid dehalogenase type II [Acidocella sp.]
MTSKAKAVLFDVFGTLVDWRGSVSAGLAAFGAARNISADWLGITDAWRGAYKPAMDSVRRGEIAWTNLDELHRGALATLLPKFGVTGVADADLDILVKLWHQLTPWPDSVAGLTALKQRVVIGSLSNGHVALQVALAKHTGFPWDMIFASDIFGHYKPDPEVYLGACKFLGFAPGEVMLAASHNEDLAAARKLGMQAGFISRPQEFGAPDERAKPAQDWEIVATSVPDLAAQLKN